MMERFADYTKKKIEFDIVTSSDHLSELFARDGMYRIAIDISSKKTFTPREKTLLTNKYRLGKNLQTSYMMRWGDLRLFGHGFNIYKEDGIVYISCSKLFSHSYKITKTLKSEELTDYLTRVFAFYNSYSTIQDDTYLWDSKVTDTEMKIRDMVSKEGMEVNKCMTVHYVSFA